MKQSSSLPRLVRKNQAAVDDSSGVHKKAVTLGMSMLSRRELCSGELRYKLRARNFSDEVVEAALLSLQQRSLQSDQRCAEVLVREHVLRGHGQIRIRQDLSRRGVEDELIDTALSECGCDFGELAEKVLRQRYGDEAPSSHAERAKRMSFLQRRGFIGSDCRAAVDASS